MPDYTGLAKVIKQAAQDAADASKPAGVCFGKVISTSPLQIHVDQKLDLGPAQLVLTAEWETELAQGGQGEGAYDSHKHRITGIKLVTIHNGLAVGDQVILLQQQGGQKYIVLDKVG